MATTPSDQEKPKEIIGQLMVKFKTLIYCRDLFEEGAGGCQRDEFNSTVHQMPSMGGKGYHSAP